MHPSDSSGGHLDFPVPEQREHLCYVHCNSCDTILAVSVPWRSLARTIIVKCGYCKHLLSVPMIFPDMPAEQAQAQVSVPWRGLARTIIVKCGYCKHLLSVPMIFPDMPAEQAQAQESQLNVPAASLLANKSAEFSNREDKAGPGTMPLPGMDAPPKKRQRLPSVYNRFIKAEIQRIKSHNPEIKHKEAFRAAAKNWAHCPDMKFGITVEKRIRCTAEKERKGIEDIMIPDGELHRIA